MYFYSFTCKCEFGEFEAMTHTASSKDKGRLETFAKVLEKVKESGFMENVGNR